MFCQNTVARMKRTRANYEKKSCEYKKWEEIHDLSGECVSNFNGSSNAMYVAHHFRYTTILSDGDARTFNHHLKLNIYGDNFIIRKEECIKHVI